MSELTCGICLDDLKSPVSTPCGHLHCKKCMHEHVKSSADAIQSTCPTCRSPFYTVTLDPIFVPAKYHPFIIPCLPRIYLNADPSRSSAASRQVQEQVSALKKENEDLASKLKGRDRDIKLLMTKCESHGRGLDACKRRTGRKARERTAVVRNEPTRGTIQGSSGQIIRAGTPSWVSWRR
ncbi:hypothetical protein BDM02DRAFT_392791 [Thelephora ganbajun]|uniref:Uncharacterized protein n=1 Tax=Thelephora ganbajun TaxID=370292 RepID=A0ACB6Z8M8_THEGA|nr:hypothetical protein BDM02DRAFT_392791 [Thelephora ganbajun]